jgi:hypothetical protein
MRLLFATLILLGFQQAVAGSEARQEIRFCPADVARTYPLDSRARVQSLPMPHMAVINHAAAPNRAMATPPPGAATRQPA